MIPVVAIVGRPNVGKSTLFNRLIGHKHAVISNIPGTTRDRIYKMSNFGNLDAMLVDTGGIEKSPTGEIETSVQTQAETAIKEADLIVFVIDGTEDLTTNDLQAAEILRKSKKPIVLIASKADSSKIEEHIFNLYKLGFGDPIKISSIHNQGIETLIDNIENVLKKLGFKPDKKAKKQDKIINIALIGKPNVGKSSLVNAILGEKKIIVSDQPGTTRDSIDTPFSYNDTKYNLIDTAGLRKRGRIEKGIEKYSVIRTIQSIDKCDIAVLVIDASEYISKQDCHASEYILEAGKGLIIALNKTDLLDENAKKRILLGLKRKMPYVPWAPVVYTSAKTKENIEMLLKLAKEIYEERKKRIPELDLNIFLEKTIIKHPPKSSGRKRLTIYSGTQSSINPPELTLFVNDKEGFHFSYLRYLENEIRKKYGFTGTAIRIELKNQN